MGFFPQPRITFVKGAHFHNILVCFDRLELAPKPLLIAAVAAMIGGTCLLWPGLEVAAFAIAALALFIEERILTLGVRAGKISTPFAGPFLIFSIGHAGATAAVGVLPLSLSFLIAIHALIQMGLMAAMAYGTLVEPFKVGWREVELDLDLPRGKPSGPQTKDSTGRPADEKTLKIFLLSDLHLERHGVREDQVLKFAREFEPDLVVWPGDFVNLSFVGDTVTADQTRDLIRELLKLAPVYVSLGTIEVDPIEWVEQILEGTDAVLLNRSDEIISVGGIEFHAVGIPYQGREKDRVAFLEDFMERADSRPVMLLHHSPDMIEEAARLGVHLYFAGHTHGGQIRLPVVGPLFTASRFFQKYAWGSYEVGPTRMVVSRGIGMEGVGAPRLRFLCAPEVVGIKLRLRCSEDA